MAQRIVNNAIEFAYANDQPYFELKRELEKYFLYQNIAVIDERYESGELIEKLIDTTKCKFTVYRNFQNLTDIENIDAIILVNFYSSNSVKKICKKYSIPYIFLLTKICDASNFKPYYYDEDLNEIQCNYPLGIFYDITKTNNAKVATTQAIMEISSLSFDILQSKLENMFFGTKIDYEYLNNQQKLIQNFQTMIIERKDDIKVFFKSISQLYLSYILISSQSKFNIADNLIYLYRKQSIHNLVEVKNVFRTIILSLEKNFFMYYKKTFLGPINYCIHQKKLDFYGYKANPCPKQLVQSKVDFILNEFRKKLLNFVNISINFETAIKNILADIDVDNLYNISTKLKEVEILDYINLEPNVFNNQNFLTILYQLGLLNYNL